MRLVIALFVLAVVASGTIGFGLSLWDGNTGHRDANLRAIHYDTTYDLSAQRRKPVE